MAEASERGPALEASQVAMLSAASFAEVLDELGERASRRPGVVDPGRLADEVSSLGAEDTMALGGGAFLLHLRSEAVDETVSLLGIAESPFRVPSDTGGENRGRLFLLVVGSREASGAYLEEVATLSHVFRGEGVAEAVLEAESPEAVAALEAVRNAPRVQKLSVVDVMEPAAQRVYPDMELEEAARLMARGGHSGMPVVNKRDEIVGMISEKDLIRAFLPGYLRVFDAAAEGGGREAGGRTVKDVMSRAVMCLPTEASISEAASIIVNKNVDPLPLTRDGRWVGLISRRSLIRRLLQF